MTTQPELSPRQLAAKRAWETIRANRAAGIPPAYKAKTKAAPDAPAPAAAKMRVTRSMPVAKPVQREDEYLAAARARVEAVHRVATNGIDTASPLGECLSCRFYDRGWRSFVVLAIGRKNALLFNPAGLSTLKVNRLIFDANAVPLSPAQAPKKTIKRVIAERVEAAERLKLRYSKAAVKAARNALRSERR